ncbi:class I SAM-dependent methyltransferase [Candidatus Methanarcanum hacksteinii]|uniref:class I SAM-dependent methyltransferase n=1 Tax=Candidatus Methanarcanum hacksteinii TaxID=2911857 RepID=UPI0037DC9F89
MNLRDIEFSVADAEALPFEDGSFDAVVMRNVLWNTFDPEKAMEEACRVLKPNGIMVITDGSWQANISAWRSANPDSDRFPNHIRRDLGLGAEDVVDIFYDRLPLKNESRPAWDESVLPSLNMDIVLCDGFDDPMMEDISDVVGTGFILVARKN